LSLSQTTDKIKWLQQTTDFLIWFSTF